MTDLDCCICNQKMIPSIPYTVDNYAFWCQEGCYDIRQVGGHFRDYRVIGKKYIVRMMEGPEHPLSLYIWNSHESVIYEGLINFKISLCTEEDVQNFLLL